MYKKPEVVKYAQQDLAELVGPVETNYLQIWNCDDIQVVNTLTRGDSFNVCIDVSLCPEFDPVTTDVVFELTHAGGNFVDVGPGGWSQISQDVFCKPCFTDDVAHFPTGTTDYTLIAYVVDERGSASAPCSFTLTMIDSGPIANDVQ